ncbi:MAG: RNA polymerase factor sigma-54 [Planctomycetes bacterium]|nr:RNA polymerase factor sigma-54 [Planctomycetota bacterium]
MRFDTSQHMKMGQQMRLAPRMIQSMEILQMALPQLEERIEQELESNVTLESFEPGADEQAVEQQQAESERDAAEGERPLDVKEDGGPDDFERLDTLEQENPEAFENQYESARSRETDEYVPGSRSVSRLAGERDAKMDAMANTEARAESLTDQLLEQWAFADIDEELRPPGRLLIQHIDDDGYIRIPLPQLLEQAGAGQDRPTLETLEKALLAVQLFLEPPGVGARDTKECLLLQVDSILEAETDPERTLAWETVRTLIDAHLDDLVHNRIPRIAQQSGLSTADIKHAVEHMRRLTIHPGRALVNEASAAIVPDAIVEYDDDRDCYIAYLTDGRIPNLRVNQEYAKMASDRAVPKPDREFVRTNLSNAQWLIDALNQRRQTLLRVINVVVEAQRDFFDQGPQAMRPLPMTQVADQLGIHVATVSRAVAGKHLLTPRGVYPLRKFFTGGTQTDSGEDVSWEAIKAAMREVIDAEDKSNPLSDDAIADGLKSKGLDIARRTVAKYRSQLDIPPARMRKQF